MLALPSPTLWTCTHLQTNAATYHQLHFLSGWLEEHVIFCWKKHLVQISAVVMQYRVHKHGRSLSRLEVKICFLYDWEANNICALGMPVKIDKNSHKVHFSHFSNVWRQASEFSPSPPSGILVKVSVWILIKSSVMFLSFYVLFYIIPNILKFYSSQVTSYAKAAACCAFSSDNAS